MVADSSALAERDTPIKFHDARTSKTCIYCGRPINWMYTKFNSRLPFDADVLPRDLDPEATGWVPGAWSVKGRQRFVMAPISHYGRNKVSRVTHVAVVHRCAEYLATVGQVSA